ncbi:hypothetical protein QUB33_03135 [Microcoleus sp. B3-A4]|uniref:hypothetical protein n=1 Tax=Microcoleus sp. B3-A4 TaxID=2818653 RepID=UPI002FD181B6
MIFSTKATQKNAGQKLTDISLEKGKLNKLWSELDETSQAALSGGTGEYRETLGNTIIGPANVSIVATSGQLFIKKNLTIDGSNV